MIVKTISLKNQYSFLDVNGADPKATVYLQNDMMKNMEGEGFIPRPMMIVCPGGGYGFCSSRESEVIAVQFLKLGFNAVVLDYSVAPHRFPQALREVAATVDLIYKNAKEWNIDINRIAIIGFSAGGHLAASYCTIRNCKEVRSVIEPKPVQAAVLCYPVITADPEFAHIGSIQNLSGSMEITPEIKEKFSLEKWVEKDITPPTFIWHTQGDKSVSPMNTTAYVSSLVSKGIPYEMHIFKGGEHGMSTCDRQTMHKYETVDCKNIYKWLYLVEVWIKNLFCI